MRLHPDLGGEHEFMVLLTESYENFLIPKENKSEENHFKSRKSEDKIFADDPLTNIIYEMYEFARYNEKYNTEFLNSVAEFLEEKGFITMKQFECLCRNYKAFGMENFLKKHREKEPAYTTE